MVGFEHCSKYHHLDVWEHTLCALGHSENNFKTRLVILLHDSGKPFSCQPDGEVRHFKGHPKKSEEITRALLSRLGFDSEFTDSVARLVLNHDNPLTREEVAENPSYARELFEVQRCDTLAHNPERNERRLLYLKDIAELLGIDY